MELILISKTEFEEEEEELEEEEKYHRKQDKNSLKKKTEDKEKPEKIVKQKSMHQILESKKQDINIPLVKISNLSIELTNKNLNTEIREVKKRIKKVNLTLVKIENQIHESYKQEKININIPIIEIEKKNRKALIPLILKTKLKVDEKQPSLSKEVPRIEVMDKPEAIDVKYDKSIKRQTPIKREIIEETRDSTGEIKKREDKNFFGINSRKLGHKPVIILLKDVKSAFIGTLEEILLRIYREIEGGLPTPRKIIKIKKFIRELERSMEAEHKLFTVDFQKEDYKKIEDWDIIRDVLAQLYSQDLGFIIFKNLHLISDQYIPKDHKIKILNLEPNNILSEDIEAQKELCRILWGLIKLNEKDFDYYSLHDEFSFDIIFNIAKEKYEKYLNKIQEPFLTITKRSKGGMESEDVHFNLKHFIIRYVSNSLGFYNIEDLPKIIEYISTEKVFTIDEQNIIPDVFISENADKFANEAFEVETLFGEGAIAIKKIDETIEKYEKSGIKKLNIVLENFTLINHLKEISKKIKIHKKFLEINQRNFDLEFWALNLADNELINFNQIEEKLKKLKKGGYFPIFQKKYISEA